MASRLQPVACFTEAARVLFNLVIVTFLPALVVVAIKR